MNSVFPFVLDKKSPAKLYYERTVVAANTATAAVLSFSLKRGLFAYIDALVKASIGVAGAGKACTVTAATDVFASTAHGLAVGQPVIITATALPTGVSADTVYFVGTILDDSFKIYPTAADAAAESNVIDATTTGTAVVANPIVLTEVHHVRGSMANYLGTPIAQTTTNVLSLANRAVVSSVALGVAANVGKITLTSNVNLSTRIQVSASVLQTAINS